MSLLKSLKKISKVIDPVGTALTEATAKVVKKTDPVVQKLTDKGTASNSSQSTTNKSTMAPTTITSPGPSPTIDAGARSGVGRLQKFNKY